MEITIYGVLVGAILPLSGYLLFHRLAVSRDKDSRYAKACNDFRSEVINGSSIVPDENTYWDNDVLASTPEIVNRLRTAVVIFKYFLSNSNGNNLEETWSEFKDLIENKIPKAHSKAEVMYGGGQMTAKESKIKFIELKNKLIGFAKEI